MKYACTGQKEGKVLIYWIEVNNWGGRNNWKYTKVFFSKGNGNWFKRINPISEI